VDLHCSPLRLGRVTFDCGVLSLKTSVGFAPVSAGARFPKLVCVEGRVTRNKSGTAWGGFMVEGVRAAAQVRGVAE
jgi:hypothetical protein